MDTKHKVAALVVTYNRLTMLKECIESLRNQTYKNFDIIVVNNGSTDGTEQYLDTQTDIIAIHQDNVGGAGGFYTGMKYMYEHAEYDALWMMDDDGIASTEQLQNLLLYSQKYKVDYCNALLLNRDDRTKMNDGVTDYNKEYYDHLEFIQGEMSPFNGTLVYRYVIEKIGLIKKEMFIWGDEMEYLERVNRKGYNYGTITRAIHYHPAFKSTLKNVIPFMASKQITFKPKQMAWIYYRNKGYLDATYGGHSWIPYCAYYLLRMNVTGMLYFLKYYRKGKKGDFSR